MFMGISHTEDFATSSVVLFFHLADSGRSPLIFSRTQKKDLRNYRRSFLIRYTWEYTLTVLIIYLFSL